MLNRKILLFVLMQVSFVFAQTLEVEDLFYTKEFLDPDLTNVEWSVSGNSILHLDKGRIIKHDLFKDATRVLLTDTRVAEATGKGKKIKWFKPSPDGMYLLITTYKMPRYNKPGGDILIYSFKSKKFIVIPEGDNKQWVPGFVGGSKIAFVRNNNLFVYNYFTEEEKQLTFDGGGTIINGHFDWVYQEELDGKYGWEASSDGRTIAFFRLDEKNVPEISIAKWDSLYFNSLDFRYPKPGAPNSEIKIGVIDIPSGKTRWVEVEGEDYYLPRIKFTKNPNVLSYQKLNRLQNKNELFLLDVKSMESKLVLTEESDAWVDVHENLKFLNDDKFFWTSEKSGFNNLYLFGFDGEEIEHYDLGKAELEKFCGIDTEKELIYYTSNERGTIYTDLYSVKFDGSDKKRLSEIKGTHKINMPDNAKAYIDRFSNSDIPWFNIAISTEGKRLASLIADKSEEIENFNLPKTEYFEFETKDGAVINGAVIKPHHFDQEKKYPLIVYNYSGPGSNVIHDEWGGTLTKWGTVMASKGYVFAMFDNRGTGRKGTEFKHVVYKQLGTYEVNDITEGVNYLVEKGIADEERVAIIGWSYGGYVALSAICREPEVYKVAVSIAPVTDYRFYDNIYTERFMQTPALNPEGYDKTAVQTHIRNLKGDVLLVHGTADDNVHLQNSIDFVKEAIKANKQIRTFFYPERNHSIYGDNARYHLFTMFTEFIIEKL